MTSPSEDISKPFGEDDSKLDGGEDGEVVGRYFETLGTSSPGIKLDDDVTEPPPLDTQRLMRTRLSISARFLSRSNQPGRYEPVNLNFSFSSSSYVRLLIRFNVWSHYVVIIILLCMRCATLLSAQTRYTWMEGHRSVGSYSHITLS